MLLFALDADDHGLATGVAERLDVPLTGHEDRRFEDGEHKLRPRADPRGQDVYVLLGLHGGPADSPHDKLFRLLAFVGTLRDHGAARVTAVVPYLAYARKDRRTQPLDPLTLRYVAQMFEAVGTCQVVVLEAHNVAAFQNAFRCPTLHLDAHHAFDAVLPALVGDEPLAVASPDPGGVKRALLWRESLEAKGGAPVRFAMVDKRRSLGVVSSDRLVAGDVGGATVLLIDDLIASGGTMCRAAAALRAAGARRVLGFAAHGLFVGEAATMFDEPCLDAVVVTDSVPPFRLPDDARVHGRLHVAPAAPLFAEAIRRCREAWTR